MSSSDLFQENVDQLKRTFTIMNTATATTSVTTTTSSSVLERKVWISPAGGVNRLSYHQYLPEVLLCAYAEVDLVAMERQAEGH